MTAPRVCWWWIKPRLIRLAGLHGGGEGVVYFKDDALGAVVAVELGLVLALHDGEGVQDVINSVARCGESLGQGFRLLNPLGLWAEVEVEEGGVQLAAEQEAALLVPAEWWAGEAAVLCEGFEVPSGVRQFQGT